MTTQTVQIIVSSKGTVTVRKEIDEIGKSSRKTATDVDFLKGALTSFLSAKTINAFAALTSSFTDYSSRVGMAIDKTQDASDVMNRLQDMAQRTYSAFTTTTDGFINNAQALQALSANTQDTLNYTEALNNAMVVSGAKAERAEAVQTALSRAMMKGKLSGIELNTVLTQGGEIATLLAQRFGTTADKLIDIAHQGRITGSVIYNTLIQNFDLLRQKAEQMPATIEDGFQRIRNALFYTIGLWDQNAQLSSTFAEALVWVSNNINLVLLALSPLAVALTALAVQIIGMTLVNALTSLVTALGLAAQGMYALSAAIVANPLVAMGIAIAAVMIYLIDFQTVIENLIKVWANFVYEWYNFWGNESGKAYAIEIFVNADKAVADLKQVAEDMKLRILSGAPKFREEIEGGSARGAGMMRDGIVSGANTAASRLAAAQDAAMRRYEQMNGKAVKEIGNAHIEGGKFIYNQATGAIQKAAPPAAKTLGDGVKDGGAQAGANMGEQIKTAGATVGRTMYDALLTGGYEIAKLIKEQIQAQTDLLRAQVYKTMAEAAEKQGASPGKGSGGAGDGSGDGTGAKGRRTIESKSSGPIGGSDPYSAAANSGGYRGAPMTSGGVANGGGQLSQTSSLGSSKNEPKVVSQTSSSRIEGEPAPVKITNVIDPKMLVDAMDSAKGQRSVVNGIKANRDEILAILGIA